MARELHDTLAHSLSAVAVQLEAVDSAMTTAPDEARVILGKALAQTRSGLTETRRALHELRATPLDDLGLALAIQNLAITTAQRNGMTATVSLPEGALNLPPEIEQGVYRIAQEALTNAARHAGATQLKVTLCSNGAVSPDGGGQRARLRCETVAWRPHGRPVDARAGGDAGRRPRHRQRTRRRHDRAAGDPMIRVLL